GLPQVRSRLLPPRVRRGAPAPERLYGASGGGDVTARGARHRPQGRPLPRRGLPPDCARQPPPHPRPTPHRAKSRLGVKRHTVRTRRKTPSHGASLRAALRMIGLECRPANERKCESSTSATSPACAPRLLGPSTGARVPGVRRGNGTLPRFAISDVTPRERSE